MTLSTSNTSQQASGLLRTYIRTESIVFYKTKEDFGGLSNMAAGYPLQINGVRILTSEALYQACRFPHLPDIQQEIIKQHSPMAAKMKSKPHRNNSRQDWDEIRYKIMRWCLRVKLAQNYNEFSKLLISTYDKPIVEQSRKDDYWGAKLTDASGDTLVGQNILGRLLMELRESIKEKPMEDLKIVNPLSINDFLLLNESIGTISAQSAHNSKPQPQPQPQSTLF